MALTTAQRTLAIAGIVAACGSGIYALGTTQAGAATQQPAITVAGSSAGPGTAANGITVTGTGDATGTPNELQLNLSVNTQAASVSTALGEANQDMTNVHNALRAHGVADADLQTSGMSIQPDYAQGSSINGYQVTESLTAILRDMGTAGAAIGAAAASGGNATRIDDVTVALSDPSDNLLETARSNAMADAKAKAQRYAGAAGQSLGPVISITEAPAGTGVVQPTPASAAAASPSVPVSAGSQQVSVTVTVTYALG
jgi:hypothetical protein